jgi:hypothetical protein
VIDPRNKSVLRYEGLRRRDEKIVGADGKAVIVDDDGCLPKQEHVGKCKRGSNIYAVAANHEKTTLLDAGG